MQFWRRSVLEVGLIGLLVLYTGPAYALEEAETDSLVAYVEVLEWDIAQCELSGRAVQDSLEVRLRIMGWELEASRALEARWYESPILHFVFDAAAMALVYGATINLTF